jgi:WD40 repeat protein
VTVWDLEKRSEVRTATLPKAGSHAFLSWSLDSKTFVMLEENHGVAHLIDVQGGTRVAQFVGLEGSINGLHWSSDGKTVAAINDLRNQKAGVVQVWDVASRKHRTFEGHTQNIRATAFAPNAPVIASAGDDATVRLWDLADGKQRSLLKGHEKRVTRIAWSPDGTTLASGSDDESVRLWPIEKGGEPVVLPRQGGPVEVLVWSPDGQRVATAAGRQVHVWDTAGTRLHSWQFDRVEWTDNHWRNESCTLIWTPDSKTLITGRFNGSVVTLDATTGKRLATLLSLRNGHGIALSAEGHFSGSQGIELSLVYVIETEKGRETLSATEFKKRFGWENDPGRVVVTAP